MTVAIISCSISMKVWGRAGIQLASMEVDEDSDKQSL